MQAAWYDQPGDPHKVLRVGTVADPEPGPDELRFRVAVSGINAGDVKKRSDAFGLGMPYPRIIPHSDGAGIVDAVGTNVSTEWLGQTVWCFGAQSYRPFGTAAELCVVPVDKAVLAPPSMPVAQGACLGIPGLTAHRAVHVAGPVKGKTVLVQGGAGAVGVCAVQLAHRAGAHVIATVRREEDIQVAHGAGADAVVFGDADMIPSIERHAPDGVDHVVEVAFGNNIAVDVAVLREAGTIASYATTNATPSIPFWPLVFKNIGMFFLGSDDFPFEAKRAAADAINAAFEAGWSGFATVERFPLAAIAEAHARVEHPVGRARVVLEP